MFQQNTYDFKTTTTGGQMKRSFKPTRSRINVCAACEKSFDFLNVSSTSGVMQRCDTVCISDLNICIRCCCRRSRHLQQTKQKNRFETERNAKETEQASNTTQEYSIHKRTFCLCCLRFTSLVIFWRFCFRSVDLHKINLRCVDTVWDKNAGRLQIRLSVILTWETRMKNKTKKKQKKQWKKRTHLTVCERDVESENNNDFVWFVFSFFLNFFFSMLDSTNRFHNRFDQRDLLVVRQSSELRKPIHRPKENVWWKIEWRESQADVDDVRMSVSHQSNANFAANSTERFKPSLLSFRFLKKKKKNEKQLWSEIETTNWKSTQNTDFFECSKRSCLTSLLSVWEIVQPQRLLFVVSAFKSSSNRSAWKLVDKTGRITGRITAVKPPELAYSTSAPKAIRSSQIGTPSSRSAAKCRGVRLNTQTKLWGNKPQTTTAPTCDHRRRQRWRLCTKGIRRHQSVGREPQHRDKTTYTKRIRNKRCKIRNIPVVILCVNVSSALE